MTQRAYTLRLDRGKGRCGTCGRNACSCWREALWLTHEAVNRGAKAFGEWLLTLRGGLCHTLAAPDVPGKGGKKRLPTPEQFRARRILLALSWLTVEDERGAPHGAGVRVATGKDDADRRGRAVEAALREILRKRGVAEEEIDGWIRDCAASLKADIRKDAVWVNRSLLFDRMVERWKCFDLDRGDALQVLEWFFGDIHDYLRLPEKPEEEQGEPNFRARARGWISRNFGTGKKSKPGAIARMLRSVAAMRLEEFIGKPGDRLAVAIARAIGAVVHEENVEQTLKSIVRTVGWKGRRSGGRRALESACREPRLERKDLETLRRILSEEADKKGSTRTARPAWVEELQKELEADIGFGYVVKRDLVGEYSTMLDHAARRVSIVHSWVKRNEKRRQTFEEHACKLEDLRRRAPEAVSWLERFREERSVATGSVEGYRIRERAVAGWADVVRAWSHPSCATEEDRIEAARELQGEPDTEEKFGDIQLFERLASDEAVCVWRTRDGRADPTILADYVAAVEARYRQRSLKVPAYRHPDPLRNPVFCDFGNSRWMIRFAVHEEARARRRGRRVRDEAHDRCQRDRADRGLRLGLWNGRGVGWVALRWSCKRLGKDLALDGPRGASPVTNVPRADRLGRAASNARGSVVVGGVFEEREWNGRLQAPRRELDRIARLQEKGRCERAKALRERLGWFLTFSPRLQPRGPFIDYAARLGIKRNKTGQYFPHFSENTGRGKLAKLVLSRLPGLRILSVDLGHRFAAACAVWQAIPGDEFRREIGEGVTVLAGGDSGDDLYLHIRKPESHGRLRRVIYRRIGPDRLPDGTPHPAPWARLDRQFLIKLQGEEAPARKASRQEIDRVLAWERDVGRVRQNEHDALPRRVDLLMLEAVTCLRRALVHHGHRARIAFHLAAVAARSREGVANPPDPKYS